MNNVASSDMGEEEAMAKEAVIRASDLYRSGGQVLKRVAVGKESLIVESNGYPIVALLPYAEYEALKRERARLELERAASSGPAPWPGAAE
jgi:prevent-host-death family protein